MSQNSSHNNVVGMVYWGREALSKRKWKHAKDFGTLSFQGGDTDIDYL